MVRIPTYTQKTTKTHQKLGRNKDITDFISFNLIKEKKSLNLINFNKKEYEIKVISKNILKNHIKNNIGHN